MAENAGLRVVVSGMVQSVMFRDFTRRKAAELNLTGFVRNLPGGNAVEVEAEGERPALEALLALLRQGPSRARVESVAPVWGGYTGTYRDFKIR